MTSRRFPSPWRADPMPGGYVVRDANGQALAYLYSRDNEDEARQAKVLTTDEARRIAVDIARLPVRSCSGREIVIERAALIGTPRSMFALQTNPRPLSSTHHGESLLLER